jgi:hypothetical protein
MANIIPDGEDIQDLPQLRKHIAAVHVAGDLTLIERKIINVLLLNAYDDLLTQEEHTISIALLCRMIGWKASKNYDELKKAIRRIKAVVIDFDVLHEGDKPSEWTATNPLGEATLHGGMCTYSYGPRLRQKLANPDIYAVINMNIQRKFQGAYALALYENCIRFRKVGSTGWISVDDWKRLFGVAKFTADKQPVKTAYDAFKVFSAKVIKTAVSEVNQVSNIIVTPEYQKTGKTVTAIRFLIEDNPQLSMLDGSAEAEALKQTEAYKALAAIGCNDTFIRMVIEQEGEERALELARESDKPTVENPPAYARTLFKTGARFNKPAKKKEAGVRSKKAADDEEKEKDRRAGAANSAAAQLTDEEHAALQAEFIAATPGAKVSPKTGRISGTHGIAFKSYVLDRTPDVIAQRGA